jgi:hypothetical protein
MWMRYLPLTLLTGALALASPGAVTAHGPIARSHDGMPPGGRVVVVPRHHGLHVPRAFFPAAVGPVTDVVVSPDVSPSVSPPAAAVSVPDPPALREGTAPARRPVPVAEPKIVLPPPPAPQDGPCSHTVVVYRGSREERHSFPISPCPAGSPATKPARTRPAA